MSRALHKLVKWSYFVVALALILLAVLVQSGRSFSHLLGDYNQNIAAYFSSELNAQVTIGKIEADWGGLKPSLLIQDFAIQSQLAQPIVAFKQARLRLDILESLRNFRLVWSNLSLSQVDMTFAQTDNGFWHIPGLPARADKPGVQLDSLLDMLLLSTRIEFEQSHLSFNFVSGKKMLLDSPYLLLENADDFHRLTLQIDVDEQPRSIYLVVEGVGDPRDQDDFRSSGHIQINRFPTSEPFAATSAFLLGGAKNGSPLSEGMVDANIWFESRAGGVGYDLVGRFGLERLSLPLGERSFSLDNFATELTGYWLPSGEWRLGLQKISAATREQAITDLNLAVASTGFKQPLQISLDSLDLEHLGKVLDSAGALGNGKLSELVKRLRPRGQLRNAHVTVPLQQPDEWVLRANLNQVATDALQGVPALAGVDGYLQAGKAGGFVDIDSQQHFSMLYSPTYSAPMVYDHAKGQIAWHLQREKNQVYVNSGKLEFRQGDESAFGYVWLALPWQRNTGDIDLYLQIGATQVDASRYQTYTPATIPQSLRDWLAQSIGEKNPGRASQAGFVYRGTLNTANSQARTFQLYLDVADAEVNYHPDWPGLTQVDTRILVSDSRVHASVSDAVLYSSRINAGEVRVSPHPQGRGSLLNIQGKIAGAASDGLRVLREGALRQYLGSGLDSWVMHGDIQTQLDLALPIGTGNQKAEGAYQRVAVELDVPRFELQNLDLSLNDLTGQVSYNSAEGISSDRIKAHFFDEPIEASLRTRKLKHYSKTVIAVNGVVDTRKIAAWSKRPEALFFKGNLPYNAVVELSHRPQRTENQSERNAENVSAGGMQSVKEFAESAFAQVTVTSNLADVLVDLPAPYGKSAKGERPLEFKLWLQENQTQIKVGYNNDIQALLRTNRSKNGGLITANVALASQARLTDEPQFLVSGYLPDINLDAWKLVQRRYQTYTERFSPVIARGLSPAGTEEDSPPLQDAPVGLIAGLPFRAELMLGQHQLGSATLENLNVIAVPVRDGWQLDLENNVVAGKLLVPDSPLIPLKIELDRVSLTRSMLGENVAADTAIDKLATDDAGITDPDADLRLTAPAKDPIDPRALPFANITIGSLVVDGSNYGNWSLQLRPNSNGVVIDNIRGSIRGVSIRGADNSPGGAQLIWEQGPGGVQSRFVGDLHAADLADVLRAWGKPDTIDSQVARFHADLSWPGSPQDFRLVDLTGDMTLSIEKGSFKRDVNAGDGILRLMSILNFDTLARRLRFDFSDLYKSGLAYDTINGKVNFNHGVLVFSEPLIVRTPSSGMQLAGSINLRDETLNTRLVATLPVAGNMTFYAALATGLPAAAGIYIVSKLFKKQVDQATSVSYTIKGAWEEPKMRFDRLFESEQSLRDSVNKKDDEAPSPANDRQSRRRSKN